MALGWEKDTCKPVAIKMIDKRKTSKSDLEIEVNAMKRIGPHPHVVEYLGHFEKVLLIEMLLLVEMYSILY